MGTAHAPLPASFSRFLSDAERWAAAGDPIRSQRVLALAADLATPARVPAVLLAWHAAGDAPPAPPRPAAPAAALAPAPVLIAELDPAGLPIPDFPTAPPTVDLGAPRGMAPTPLVLPVDAAPPLAHTSAEPPPLLEPRTGGGLLKGIVMLALIGGATWMYLPAGIKASLSVPGIAIPTRGASVEDAEAALLTGDAKAALEIARELPAEGAEAPRGHLVRGRALLATGDTTGAAAALTAAAQGDNRGTVAWTAAEALSALPGHEPAAADAYLLSFAAGLPAARAETVARAQERAGRPDRARRVREQAAQ